MIYGKKTIGTIAYMGGVMSLPEPFVWSWSQMIEYNNDYLVQPGEGIFYDRIKMSYHAAARNALVERMRGDWLLMLDTDHQFEPDIAARLVHRMLNDDLDVIVGLYVYKSEPHPPQLYNWNEKGDGFEMMGDWDIPKGGSYYIPVGSAGAGALLVRKMVYQQIKEELNEGPFDIIHPFSEDHSFFKRLQKLGLKAYCDPAIEVPHLTYQPLTLQDFNKKDITFIRKET